MELPLTQSWLPQQEDGFRPGLATFSYSDGNLHLKAELIDEDVSSIATKHGQKLWEHGDVVEFFIQKEGDSGYREYQVAPNGFTLALHYPEITCVAAVRSGERHMEEFLTKEIPAATITMTSEGWQVLMSISLPASRGERFRVSCCRYDAGNGRPPIISSTSAHSIRDFHRPQDWREFIPVPA